ncbi:MAG: AAA family ATPase [Rhodospirillaceae bacterium]|nr:AAA family ATPase [Rhodospirillaceae bacterium]
MSQKGDTQGRIIVLGNEKGGTGKSTTAMHLVVALMRSGHDVGTVDLDGHQGTFSRYVENRKTFSDLKNMNLLLPDHRLFRYPPSGDVADTLSSVDQLVTALRAENDYVVLDCPGSDNPVARHAISLADILITPVNDSFIDIDLLARIGGTPPRIIGPSVYAQIVWEQKQERAVKDGGRIDWVVLRNRLSPLGSRNQKNVGITLEQLATRIGFRLIDGFLERVIFRQLFLQGLTVLDLRDEGAKVSLNLSHVAARQEIRSLLEALKLNDDPALVSVPVDRATLTSSKVARNPDSDGEYGKGENCKPLDA